MATEPTLGEQIMDAALEWAGVWARVKAHDRDSFEDEDEAHARLRALAARADAAESLAKAVDAWAAVCDGTGRSYRDHIDAHKAMTEALAAWRALGEVPA